MPLSKEAIEKLEATLKIEKGTLEAALSSEEETTIELPELVVRSKEEETKYLDNLKDQYKNVGIEIAIKDAKAEMGLEFEGKNISDFAAAISNKAIEDKKAEFGEPNKKIEELTKEKQTLQSSLQKKDEELNSFKNQMQIEKDSFALEAHVLGAIPENTTLDKKKISVLFKDEYSLGFDENKRPVVKKGDEILKNDVLDPLSVEEVMNTFVTSNNLLKGATGGAGGSDEVVSGKAGTYEHFAKEMESKNINPGSEAFNREMIARQKNGTLKM